MKKIGIMTMQRIANYGSFLQAYALKKIMEELGFVVEFVDYHVEPPILQDLDNSSSGFIRKIKKGMDTLTSEAPLAHKIAFIRHKQLFKNKYIPMLGITKSMNYNPKLDCLIIGSDEVFNCIQSNSNVGYSRELFGKDNVAKRLISYAASFGNTTYEKLNIHNKANEISDLLSKFDAISVRDNNSGLIVEKLIKYNPKYNLDPVLTYDYMNCCNRIPKLAISEKYIILYAYSGRITDSEALWIKAYAKKRNLKIYSFGGVQKSADKFIDCSPFELLSYFNNAEEIITDTFHGCIFSIIAHKPFSTLVRKSIGNSYGNEEKISDLMERLGLCSHMTTDINDVERINKQFINYKQIDKVLQNHRKLAYEYLRENVW